MVVRKITNGKTASDSNVSEMDWNVFYHNNYYWTMYGTVTEELTDVSSSIPRKMRLQGPIYDIATCFCY